MLNHRLKKKLAIKRLHAERPVNSKPQKLLRESQLQGQNTAEKL